MASLTLIFAIDGRAYALDAARVEEIDALPAISPVPALPEYVAGLCNLRGAAVPVVDLCKLWGAPHSGEYRCILLLRHEGAEVAVMADEVIETRSREAALIGAGAASGGFVSGIFPDKTAILDADRLLKAIFGQAEG